MVGRLWLQPPRRVLASFLAVVVACVGTLAWLGFRLLDQDRALESQRLVEQLEIGADLAAAGLDRELVELEQALDVDRGSAGLPDGTVLVIARAADVEVHGGPLLFLPDVHSQPESPNPAIRRAELAEFQGSDLSKAAAAFRDLARSTAPALRAAALVGLGRCLRKAGRTPEAIAAYAELEALGATVVAGLPADLVAREARCSALETAGRRDDLRREAAALRRDLEGGRWRLTRSAYEYRSEEARRWSGDEPRPDQPTETAAVSEAVAALAEEWRNRPEGSSGRRVRLLQSQTTLAVWRATREQIAVIVAGQRYLEPLWLGALTDQRMRLALTDPEGRAVYGQLPAPAERAAVRAAAVTQLPWTIHVSASDLLAPGPEADARRRLLLAGLSVLAVLLVVSSWFVARAMVRELAVARLQSEFVASVSHEFRSPLTSIRQLSSLLGEGRLASEEQRQRSYEFLAEETGRLERLIEGLLDFGLVEAGEARYRLEPCDARHVVRDTASIFQRSLAGRDCHVELAVPDSACSILADRDALGRAIWNLLDNAVKYSPQHRTVWVDVARRNDRVAIAVRDRGMGVPAAEQRAIFRKFFRGTNSKEARIKGTGIGLAMVQHIVSAHGGEVAVESAPGDGSRFTILLPVEGAA